MSSVIVKMILVTRKSDVHPYDRADAPPGAGTGEVWAARHQPLELTGGDSPVTAAVRSIC
jgi:hypothetical protein